MSTRDGPIRVFICDDQAAIRRALTDVLVSLSVFEKVGEGEDGDSCIAGLVQTQPDVLILDVGMPRGGPGLARRAKELLPNLAIIVFSAHRDDQIKAAMLDAGAQEYVVKTGRLLPLREALNRVADSWGQSLPTD